MSRQTNPLRGEANLNVGRREYRLRASFENLVAAEEELGSLFALVERASEGVLTLHEIAALLLHCVDDEDAPTRKEVGDAVIDMGLVAATRPVRAILAQVLQGRG